MGCDDGAGAVPVGWLLGGLLSMTDRVMTGRLIGLRCELTMLKKDLESGGCAVAGGCMRSVKYSRRYLYSEKLGPALWCFAPQTSVL
jgi:hypothetical protein